MASFEGLVKQLGLTGFQMWDQMAEKGTKKGPILANFDQKSIEGTILLFPRPNWTHWLLSFQHVQLSVPVNSKESVLLRLINKAHETF